MVDLTPPGSPAAGRDFTQLHLPEEGAQRGGVIFLCDGRTPAFPPKEKKMNEITPIVPEASVNAPAKRRRRGRTLFLGALFLGAAAVLTTGALQAFGLGPFRSGACSHMDPAQVEKKIDRIAGWIVEDLDGTPEQQAKLAAIAKAAAKDLAPLHDELVAGKQEVVAILTAEKVDRAALEAHRVRHVQLMEEASERLVAAVADAADVLTPAQRAEAAAKLETFHSRFGH